MKKRKKGRRFTFSANRQSSSQRASAMEPDNLAVYVRRAEKEVLPIIKEMHLGPGAAQFLLAQQTQVLVTGDPRITIESGMAIATSVLALWQRAIIRQVQRTPTRLKRRCRSFKKAHKQRRTTRHVSNHLVLRTGRGHAASAKWPGGLCNIPRRSCGKSG